VEISVEELAAALIRTGWFFPSQRADADTAAQDIFGIIEEGKGPGDTGFSAYQDRRR
jgi:hypothetical protein